MIQAVLFPGQGSQRTGMGRFYYDNFPLAKQTFESASEELKINFKKLCFEESENVLNLTQNAQPAIVLVSCTAWLCLSQQIDLKEVQFFAGHSVGEYSALCAGGFLSLNSALKAVRKRGLLMSACSQKNLDGMSALIGPPAESAKDFCKWVKKQDSSFCLEPANFNTPYQTVLSGSLKALDYAKTHLKDYFKTKSAKMIPLKVSGAFHSSLMKPAGEEMRIFLKTLNFQQSKKMIVPNVSAQPELKLENIRENLSRQIHQPVEWVKSMHYLFEQRVQNFLELGEGKVLAGLMKKIREEKKVFHFQSMDDIKNLC